MNLAKHSEIDDLRSSTLSCLDVAVIIIKLFLPDFGLKVALLKVKSVKHLATNMQGTVGTSVVDQAELKFQVVSFRS